MSDIVQGVFEGQDGGIQPRQSRRNSYYRKKAKINFYP